MRPADGAPRAQKARGADAIASKRRVTSTRSLVVEIAPASLFDWTATSISLTSRNPAESDDLASRNRPLASDITSTHVRALSRRRRTATVDMTAEAWKSAASSPIRPPGCNCCFSRLSRGRRSHGRRPTGRRRAWWCVTSAVWILCGAAFVLRYRAVVACVCPDVSSGPNPGACHTRTAAIPWSPGDSHSFAPTS